MKLEKKIKIKNDLGLHIRPAATIVKLLQEYKSSVYFTYNGMTINARSIMSILTLVAKKNAMIKIAIYGSDAKKVLNRLDELFKKGFGEK